ncbi:hypothetical protein [Pseudooceanicola sp. LIPI14-2-Ac024]|uniref:hypothetical protein n=1 Tax=Pseudooceanicola sp. LIPI14-2-Ac024 TaxID=3344875 RepID=UPI0035D13005
MSITEGPTGVLYTNTPLGAEPFAFPVNRTVTIAEHEISHWLGHATIELVERALDPTPVGLVKLGSPNAVALEADPRSSGFTVFWHILQRDTGCISSSDLNDIAALSEADPRLLTILKMVASWALHHQVVQRIAEDVRENTDGLLAVNVKALRGTIENAVGMAQIVLDRQNGTHWGSIIETIPAPSMVRATAIEIDDIPEHVRRLLKL